MNFSNWFKSSDSNKVKKVEIESKKTTNKEKDSGSSDEDLDEKGLEELKNQVISSFQFYKGYQELNFEQNQAQIQKFIFFDDKQDKEEPRCKDAHSSGGLVCVDKSVVKKLRNIAKEVISDIGKKILMGDFNLTTISFPIRCMIPKSVLEMSVHGTSVFPFYMNKAALSKDPIERFKLVITATISSFFWTTTFLKPLNPILGETLEARYDEGTQVYGEQISHHPPISYFLVYGPNDSYVYNGYYLYDVKAGLNSVTIKNKGKRKIMFKDGQTITYDFPNESFSGTFIGTTKVESLGKIIFQDSQNKLYCKLKIGKVKKRPTDYLEGEIKQNDKVVCKTFGTYLGFLEFDGVKYWDYRRVTPYKIKMIQNYLQSDHLKRTDLIVLQQGNVKQAQLEKEKLEAIQRADTKLRKKNKK